MATPVERWRRTLLAIVALLGVTCAIAIGARGRSNRLTETQLPEVGFPAGQLASPAASSSGLPTLNLQHPAQTSTARPEAPQLTYFSAYGSASAMVGMTFGRRNWPYYDIYRATSPNGPWTLVIREFPVDAGSADDASFPTSTGVLYYRVVGKTAGGVRSDASAVSAIRIP